MQRCVLCETLLVGEARTREHVIPASLGGKRRTVTALCRQCNSTTGHAWDAELERQLRPAALLVFPHDHPCGRKQRRVADDEGNHLILTGGIRGGAEGPQIRIKTVADRTELHISAPSRQRAIQEIRRRVKVGQLPADREEEIIASIEREETTTRVEFMEVGGVGGPVAWNSMLKSMVTAGLLGGLTWLDMLTAVLLLRGSGRGGPCLMFRDSPVCPSSAAEIPVWRHCVHVETDMEERLVWGYVEYFGTWCAIAQLGKCYLGQPASRTYWGHRKVCSYDYGKEASSLGSTLWGACSGSVSTPRRPPVSSYFIGFGAIAPLRVTAPHRVCTRDGVAGGQELLTKAKRPDWT